LRISLAADVNCQQILGIHRHTLVYQLKQAGQLIGIKPTTTNGIARFWIAIQADKNTKLIDSNN
jgi:purine catabolism regulator